MMRTFALGIAAIQGLVAVAVLFVIQTIVAAFVPGWTFPFSVWWGMVFSIPGILMAAFFHKGGF